MGVLDSRFVRIAPSGEGENDQVSDTLGDFPMVLCRFLHLCPNSLVCLQTGQLGFPLCMQTCCTFLTLAPSSREKPPPILSVAAPISPNFMPYKSSASARIRAIVSICWFSCTPCWSLPKRTPSPRSAVSILNPFLYTFSSAYPLHSPPTKRNPQSLAWLLIRAQTGLEMVSKDGLRTAQSLYNLRYGRACSLLTSDWRCLRLAVVIQEYELLASFSCIPVGRGSWMSGLGGGVGVERRE